MQPFFQSTFLQSLGYAIANSLWQTALVWLVYVSLTGIFSVSAAVKYRLAVAAQLIGFVWFIITFQFYYSQYSHALKSVPTVPQQNLQAILSSNTDISSRMINWMLKGEQLLPYVSMAYILLMVFLCVRWMFGYRQTQLIRNNGLQKMPVEWRLFVDRIAAQLNIKQKIKIFLSETVSTPLTIGFLKPVILIPIASINHLTTDQLEAVLLHELAHIKRYDYLVNIILSVVEISLFFNPFTQLLSKSIRKERENSCDDWVLQYQYDASVYAEALLRIAYLQAAPALAMAAVGKKNELLTRVKRMIGEKENRFSYKKQLIAFVIVTGILSSVAWLNPHVKQKNDKITATTSSTKNKTASYAVEPMAVTVDNPLFNPMFFLSKPLKEEMQKNIELAQKELGESMADLENVSEEIEAVTPLVASAMQQASIALNDIDLDKEISKTDLAIARSTMATNLYSDSAFFTPKMKKQLNADMKNSVKEMEEGFKKAKAEMARGFKISGDANVENINNELMDVMNGLNGLGNIGLEKIIQNSMSLSADVINKLATQGGNTRVKSQPKEKENRKIIQGKPLQAIDKVEKVDDLKPEPDRIKVEGIKIEERSELIFPVLSAIAELEEQGYLKLYETTLAKIKTAILKVTQDSRLKIVSVLNKESKDEEKKIVLKFQ